MEDALEELVGEIYDEYDDEELKDLEEISANHYKVSPEMDIEDLFEILEIGEIPESQYKSVGGFVYSLLGGLPTEGTIVHYQSIKETEEEIKKYDLEFTIKVVSNKRIRMLELVVSELNDEEVEEVQVEKEEK